MLPGSWKLKQVRGDGVEIRRGVAVREVAADSGAVGVEIRRPRIQPKKKMPEMVTLSNVAAAGELETSMMTKCYVDLST